MKKNILLVCIFWIPFFSFSEESIHNITFDFVMQDIQDIVYAVSVAQNMSIVCDDTVFGKTSFRFTGSDFEKAAQSFLLSNRLYSNLIDGVIVLSKIRIEKSKYKSGTYSINAYDVEPSVLFNKVSEVSQIPILFELLPTTKVSLHVRDVSIKDAVSIVMKAFPDYTMETKDDSISINKNIIRGMSQSFQAYIDGNISVIEKEGQYMIDIQNGSLFESLETLFSYSGVAFCNLLDADRIITRLLFSSDNLHDALSIICSQSESGYTTYEGMYIIYGVQNASETLISSNKFWKTIALNYITMKTFFPLFQERFSHLTLLALSDSKAQVWLTNEDAFVVDDFIKICDVPVKTHLVTLQYIDAETLLSHLPPGLEVTQFNDIGTGYSLFFTGSDDAYAILKNALKAIDVPSVIIGYDVLVLQIQESESFNWRPSLSADNVSLGDRTSLSGHLGSVFALNLDVVSVFGYTFAAELQSAIGESKAKIYVDTKLQGISGRPIHFQNTNTFRYQDTAIDPDNGNPVYSGITREIIAGLILNIEGWVSGDGMVTTKVTASLSRRGADVSDNGNPPPTSEKVVTTEVRGKSGEPIILSGLVQNDSTFVEEATPFISKIPLIGWFFKGNQKNEESSEMIIYLVPHVDEITKEDFNDL